MSAEFDVCPCGGDHELACGRFLIDTYRLEDETCDEAHRRALAQHAEECEPCRSEYSLERNVKSLVQRCCGVEVAPERLRTGVQARIRALTVQMSETVISDGVNVIRARKTVVRLQRPDLQP